MSRAFPAPAKINLFLHVTGRRADGYHFLQTVFQFLDWGDEIHIEPTVDGAIHRARDLPGVPEASDLTLRAARLLKERSGTTQGARIAVEKRLPIGGGLGGGSSDAATTLMALNQLWGTGIGTDELAEIGLSLGADVPVFIRGHAAWAEGVGEILTPVEPAEASYVVVVPPVSVPTGAVFAEFDALRARNDPLTPESVPIKIRDFLEGRVRNDLEPLVRRRFPDVEAAFRLLERYRTHWGAPRLSGSGSSVFLRVDRSGEGDRILAQLPAGFRGVVARGCNHHPLRGIPS